jgi:protease-4
VEDIQVLEKVKIKMANKPIKKKKRAEKRKAKARAAASRASVSLANTVGRMFAISESGAKKLITASANFTASTAVAPVNSVTKSGLMQLEAASGMLVPTTNLGEEEVLISSPDNSSDAMLNSPKQDSEIGIETDPETPEKNVKVFNYKDTGIFRIPVHGVIVSNDYGDYPFSGFFVTPEAVIWAINTANRSPFASHIVLDINSPGGDLFLGQEVVEAIKNSEKPVYTYISGMACSQAFLYASATSRIYSARDGIAGSLGVMTSYMTEEEFEGFAVSGFAQKKNSQESAITIGNELEELYHQTIAEGRGTTLDNVRSNYGNGEEIIAGRAQSLGMIDEIKTRQSFYLDLYNEIDFEVESFDEQFKDGDVDINPDQTFELMALEVTEQPVAKVASNKTATKFIDNKKAVQKIAQSLTKSDTPQVEVLTPEKNLDEINVNNYEKPSEIKDINETKLKTTAQNKGNNNTPLNESESESKENKMPKDQTASTEGVEKDENASESVATTSSEVSSDTVVAAAAAAAATYNKMSQTQATTSSSKDSETSPTTPSDAVLVSPQELEEMFTRAHAAGVESQKKLAKAEADAKAEAERLAQERTNAIVNSASGQKNVELAKAMAENPDLADKDASVVIGILDGMNFSTPSDSAITTEDSVENVQQSVADSAAPDVTGNSPAEIALNQRLAALEEQMLKDQNETPAFAGTNVVSPMVAAMNSSPNATNASDPMKNADLIEDGTQSEKPVDPIESSALYKALKGTNPLNFDEKSAKAIVAKAQYEESVYGPAPETEISERMLARFGVASNRAAG